MRSANIPGPGTARRRSATAPGEQQQPGDCWASCFESQACGAFHGLCLAATIPLTATLCPCMVLLNAASEQAAFSWVLVPYICWAACNGSLSESGLCLLCGTGCRWMCCYRVYFKARDDGVARAQRAVRAMDHCQESLRLPARCWCDSYPCPCGPVPFCCHPEWECGPRCCQCSDCRCTVHRCENCDVPKCAPQWCCSCTDCSPCLLLYLLGECVTGLVMYPLALSLRTCKQYENGSVRKRNFDARKSPPGQACPNCCNYVLHVPPLPRGTISESPTEWMRRNNVMAFLCCPCFACGRCTRSCWDSFGPSTLIHGCARCIGGCCEGLGRCASGLCKAACDC
eukprot:Amastigsp_a189143_7.p1 type:complete len:341 gc:universal Amastigsp_a189143_7:173-1195(+)